MTEIFDNDILSWHQKKLGQERLKYMRELPIYKEFYISGRLLRLCHASPNDIAYRVYLSTEESKRLKLFEPTPTINKEADVVGYGDIHGAYVDNFHGKTLFNVGSVGNPLDITQASYGIIEGKLNTEVEGAFSISLVRVPYDIELAVKEAELTDMPEKNEYIKELRTGIYRGRKAK
jgi:predicted phosphodiesterase